jgi:hypothetical protein
MTHSATDIIAEERSSDRRVLLVLYAATATVFADMYITQPLLPMLGREFSVPPATAGLTISAVVLMIALASSAYGPLGDAWGRNPVMVWSCALLAVPTLLCAVAPSLPVLVLLRGLQGLFVPGLTAVAVAYIGDRAGNKHRWGSGRLHQRNGDRRFDRAHRQRVCCRRAALALGVRGVRRDHACCCTGDGVCFTAR